MSARNATSGNTAKRSAVNDPRENLPYFRWGIGAGVVGASAVAVFFLVVDVVQRHAFATPADLGAALFLGKPSASEGDPQSLLVFGYTLVHGALFVGLASVASSLVFGARRRPWRGPALVATLTAVFFVSLVLLSSGFWLMTESWLWDVLGVAPVMLANLLASLAMALTLGYAFRTRWRRPRTASTADAPEVRHATTSRAD